MPAPAIPVRCSNGGATCVSLDGAITFTKVNGALYQGSNGRMYQGGNTGVGITVMSEVADVRAPAAPPLSAPAAGGSDMYGTVSGLHDWYLILLALATLYFVMRVYPKWGLTLGWVVLLGAILSTPASVAGFQGLVKSIQTGSIQT